MKFPAFVSCVLVATGIAFPAAADSYDPGFSPLVQVQAQGLAPQRGAEPTMPRREMRGGNAGRDRMDAQERRQLRQDIQDAGKDIYRRDRPGRGDPRRSERR